VIRVYVCVLKFSLTAMHVDYCARIYVTADNRAYVDKALLLKRTSAIIS
jgi:hypothetical protein